MHRCWIRQVLLHGIIFSLFRSCTYFSLLISHLPFNISVLTYFVVVCCKSVLIQSILEIEMKYADSFTCKITIGKYQSECCKHIYVNALKI